MADLKKTGLLAGATAGAVVLFLNFGPVVFDKMLGGEPPAAPDPSTPVLLEQNKQILESLNATLQQLSKQSAPDGPQTGTASGPEPQEATPPPSTAIETAIPDRVPVEIEPDHPADWRPQVAAVPKTEPSPPAASIDPEPESGIETTTAMVPQEVEPPAGTASFGVFAKQKFSLCGYEGFTANLSATSQIVISTANRTTPASGFRGFEKTMPLRTPTELWQGCTVAVDHTVVSGIVRIAISVVSGET